MSTRSDAADADGKNSRRIFCRSIKGSTSGHLLVPHETQAGAPLLVCIHGGGCNAGYFELDPQAIAPSALRRHMPVLLVNRPGHAGNPSIGGKRPLKAMADAIRDLVQEVRAAHLPPGTPLVLAGHSIGGAIALMLAGKRENWPLRAVAVAGVGDEPFESIRSWRPTNDDLTARAPLSAIPLYFGPEGSYHWRAPLRLRRVAEPWVVAEVLELLQCWPALWPELASTIEVPVQLRLSENDGIWRHEPEVLARMAASFSAAPFVDVAVLPGGGHLYELHKAGAAFVRAQLDFLERWVDQKSAGRP